MKKIIYMAVIAILGAYSVQAQIKLKQKAEGEHRLSIALTPQQYLNGMNINGEGQPQTLHTQNTFGYKFGVDYQRITRQGVLHGAPAVTFIGEVEVLSKSAARHGHAQQ